MTTIAYRDGTMAADTGCFWDNFVTRSMCKITKGADGVLYGVAGLNTSCNAFLEAIKLEAIGQTPPKGIPMPEKWQETDNTFIALVVYPDGRKRILTAQGEENHDSAPFIAIGADAAISYGAMHAGADAVKAIEAAGTYGLYTSIRYGIDFAIHDLIG